MRVGLNKKQKKILYRIIIGLSIFIIPLIADLNSTIELILYIAAYIVAGGDVLLKAGKNIIHAQLLDENFLMCIATVGAFIVGEYPEGVMVMLLNQVGNLFESYAVTNSRKSIKNLVNLYADTANVIRGGEIISVTPEEVSVGETIIVKPGEKIPIDGVVIKGSSFLDTSAITGESVPRNAESGDSVISGCINLNGVIEIKTTKEFCNSTVSKIMQLVENATSTKSSAEKFITRFAKYYTPCVVMAALIIAVIPPLITASHNFSYWIHKSLIFLVVSCPCALVISVPLGFFAGIGVASKEGILFKGSNFLEALSKADAIAFDKTGTLTEGVFEIKEILAVNISNESLLEYAAMAENYSNHPISASILKAYNNDIDLTRITDAKEIAGHGVYAIIDGKTVLAGNEKLMCLYNIEFSKADIYGSVVYIAIDSIFAGHIIISDKIKENAKAAVKKINELGIKNTLILSGDRKNAAKHCADEIGITDVYSELLPQNKVEKLKEFMSKNKKTVYVGDGINDAPVIATADIGISMGEVGSDAAIEASDIVITDDNISKVPHAIKISKKTMNIVKQNIVFSLSVKILVMILTVFGLTGMYSAIFADVGVSVIAISNSVRLLYNKKASIN